MKKIAANRNYRLSKRALEVERSICIPEGDYSVLKEKAEHWESEARRLAIVKGPLKLDKDEIMDQGVANFNYGFPPGIVF